MSLTLIAVQQIGLELHFYPFCSIRCLLSYMYYELSNKKVFILVSLLIFTCEILLFDTTWHLEGKTMILITKCGQNLWWTYKSDTNYSNRSADLQKRTGSSNIDLLPISAWSIGWYLVHRNPAFFNILYLENVTHSKDNCGLKRELSLITDLDTCSLIVCQCFISAAKMCWLELGWLLRVSISVRKFTCTVGFSLYGFTWDKRLGSMTSSIQMVVENWIT